MVRLICLLVSACALVGTGAGCSSSPPQWFGFSSGSSANALTTTSAGSGATFDPKFTTAVYRYIDTNSADVYLTDMPVSRLADHDDPLTDITGTLVHVHLFLVPLAGSTPIDNTACNAAVRQFVFAGGAGIVAGGAPMTKPVKGAASESAAIGVYAGGAFVTPFGEEPGKPTLSATVRGGTVRLVQATSDFTDVMGPSRMRGTFTARHDDSAARAIAERLVTLAGELPAYTPPTLPGYSEAIRPPVDRRKAE